MDQRASRPLEPKIWASLQARAALVRFELHRICGDDGTEIFLVRRSDWNLTRELDDVDAIEKFLHFAGAPA